MRPGDGGVVAGLAGLGELVQRGVQADDIAVVVDVVVQADGLLVDVGLKGVVGVGERGELLGHECLRGVVLSVGLWVGGIS
jgi:hypothetical protein